VSGPVNRKSSTMPQQHTKVETGAAGISLMADAP